MCKNLRDIFISFSGQEFIVLVEEGGHAKKYMTELMIIGEKE